jgi:hypothetical protein
VNAWVKVARLNLMMPANYYVLPCILPVAFALGAVTADGGPSHNASGYLFSFFTYFVVQGALCVGRSLPFSLALGASRRSFYSGTALFGLSLAVLSGLLLTALQAIERATGGWGLSMHFFRIPYLLDGPWYDTWLTSAVLLFALFGYGMWSPVVQRRWGTPGTMAFIVAQAVVVGVVTAVAWPAGSTAGDTSARLPVLGLTGVIAALAVLLIAGGLATVRRTAV